MGNYDPSAYVPGVGAGHAPSFMTAGRPFLTGSTVASGSTGVRVEFPTITKNFTIQNIGSADLDVHFKPKSDPAIETNYHYWFITGSSEFAFGGKCREVYVSTHSGSGVDGEFLLYAELAAVNAGYNLTGSGIDE